MEKLTQFVSEAPARLHIAVTTSRHRYSSPRAVSMLEYVLIAAVAIVLATLFVPGLKTVFTNLFENVGTFIGGSKGKTPTSS